MLPPWPDARGIRRPRIMEHRARFRPLQMSAWTSRRWKPGSGMQPVPSGEPQTRPSSRILEILNACDACISALDHEARLLDGLFRAMLEELMSGKLSTTGLINENDVIDTC